MESYYYDRKGDAPNFYENDRDGRTNDAKRRRTSGGENTEQRKHFQNYERERGHLSPTRRQEGGENDRWERNERRPSGVEQQQHFHNYESRRAPIERNNDRERNFGVTGVRREQHSYVGVAGVRREQHSYSRHKGELRDDRYARKEGGERSHDRERNVGVTGVRREQHGQDRDKGELKDDRYARKEGGERRHDRERNVGVTGARTEQHSYSRHKGELRDDRYARKAGGERSHDRERNVGVAGVRREQHSYSRDQHRGHSRENVDPKGTRQGPACVTEDSERCGTKKMGNLEHPSHMLGHAPRFHVADSREGGAAEAKFDTNKVEDDPVRIAFRQKQILYGKNTKGYDRYINMVPKNERTREHPVTPNPYQCMSRRRFDGLVKQWRRNLHEWDASTQEGQVDLVVPVVADPTSPASAMSSSSGSGQHVAPDSAFPAPKHSADQGCFAGSVYDNKLFEVEEAEEDMKTEDVSDDDLL